MMPEWFTPFVWGWIAGWTGGVFFVILVVRRR